jgi:hypothetical protein
MRVGWVEWSALFHGPAISPSGDAAGVLIVRDPNGKFSVAAFAFPKSTVENPNASLEAIFDQHSHAVVGEAVRSLAEAQRLGEAWLRKYKRGLVLAPCACETMTTAAVTGRPTATHPSPRTSAGHLTLGRPSLAYRMAQTYGVRPIVFPGQGSMPTPPSGTRFACGPYVGPTRDTVLADAEGNPVPHRRARRPRAA